MALLKRITYTKEKPCEHRLQSKQISNCDNLLYSEYFYSFLSSEEHNEAVSHIKLSRYDEAHPLLEVIRGSMFNI